MNKENRQKFIDWLKLHNVYVKDAFILMYWSLFKKKKHAKFMEGYWDGLNFMTAFKFAKLEK